MLKNAKKIDFFSKKFAHVKKKLYLCTIIQNNIINIKILQL